MQIELFIRYFHFIGILGVFSSLVYENITVKTSLRRNEVDLLAKVDAFYGLSTLVILVTGFTMWFWIGKPAEFYGSNWIFYLNISLFTLVGIASIYPTIFFIKQRKGDLLEEVQVPRIVRILIKTEIILIVFIPFFAVLMAVGIGK